MDRRLLVGLLLTSCAGFIDAVGFIELGGYYTSFMSGNSTQLGIGTMRNETVALPLGLIVLFFIGSFAGSVLALRSRRWGPVMVLGLVIAALLLVMALKAAGLSAPQALLFLAAGAGAQNAILPFSGGARLGTTFVSGTLYAAGHDLAGALAGQAPPWHWLNHLVVWLALLVGAAIGAFAYRTVAVGALIVPGAIYELMLAAFLRRAPA